MVQRKEINSQEIAERLSMVLEQKGITNSDLAKLTGFSKSTVSAWQRGKGFTVDAISIICEALGLSSNWLLIGIGPVEQPATIELNQKEKTLIYAARSISPNLISHLRSIFTEFREGSHDLNSNVAHLTGFKFLSESRTGAVIVNLDGRILEANDIFKDLVGISLSKNIEDNPSVFDIIPLEFGAKVKKELKRIHKESDPFDRYIIKNRMTSKKIPVITKAAMVDYKNSLAIGVIVKPEGD